MKPLILISFSWHLNLLWLINAIDNLVEKLQWYYLIYIKGDSYFSKSISPKESAISRMEFVLAYFEVAIQQFNHYTIETPRLILCYKKLSISTTHAG